MVSCYAWAEALCDFYALCEFVPSVVSRAGEVLVS